MDKVELEHLRVQPIGSGTSGMLVRRDKTDRAFTCLAFGALSRLASATRDHADRLRQTATYLESRFERGFHGRARRHHKGRQGARPTWLWLQNLSIAVLLFAP